MEDVVKEGLNELGDIKKSEGNYDRDKASQIPKQLPKTSASKGGKKFVIK